MDYAYLLTLINTKSIEKNLRKIYFPYSDSKIVKSGQAWLSAGKEPVNEPIWFKSFQIQKYNGYILVSVDLTIFYL